MKKPSRKSSGSLSSKRLFDIIKTKKQWKNTELLEYLTPLYCDYDREGLGHRIRQILSELTKKGLIKRIQLGTYSARL